MSNTQTIKSRVNFKETDEAMPMPDLIKIQKDSYNWFLKEGLVDLFDELSPITDFIGPNAGFDLGFTTELKIPLYNGSKWRHKVTADKATEVSRREELAHQKKDLLLSLHMLQQTKIRRVSA